MPTYSPNLRITLIDNGEQTGTWGDTTNDNLGDIIEQAITGYAALTVNTANKVLVVSNAIDEARNAVIQLVQGTVSTNFSVFMPPVEKLYVINNQTNFSATVYCSTTQGDIIPRGVGVAIPAGGVLGVYSDGTNIAAQSNYTPSSFAVGGGLAVVGALAVAGGINGNLVGNVVGNVQGNVTGNVFLGANSITTTNFTIQQSGTTLLFSNGATNIAKLDASGNLTVLGNVTAYGTV